MRLMTSIAAAGTLLAVLAGMSVTHADIVANRPEEFAAFLTSERAKWAKIVKQSGAQVD